MERQEEFRWPLMISHGWNRACSLQPEGGPNIPFAARHWLLGNDVDTTAVVPTVDSLAASALNSNNFSEKGTSNCEYGLEETFLPDKTNASYGDVFIALTNLAAPAIMKNRQYAEYATNELGKVCADNFYRIKYHFACINLGDCRLSTTLLLYNFKFWGI